MDNSRLALVAAGAILSVSLSSTAVAQSHELPLTNITTYSASFVSFDHIADSVAKPKTAPPAAKTLIDQAVNTARAEKKGVLVHWGASWCGWCKRFDAMLRSEQVGKIFADHYVVVALTTQERGDNSILNNPGSDSVIQALQLQGGLPVYAFLDGEGKKVASSCVLPPNNGNLGHPATPEEILAFGELLKTSAPRMSEEDRKKITDYLTSKAPKPQS